MAMPAACSGSQARDQTHTTAVTHTPAVTQATAVTMPDPKPPDPRGESWESFFFFLCPHLQHMEVPVLGVESDL